MLGLQEHFVPVARDIARASGSVPHISTADGSSRERVWLVYTAPIRYI